jgi:aminomethyltransferase
MAGSSVPLTWRIPAADVKRGGKLKQIVAVSYHTLDGYGFHALEARQYVFCQADYIHVIKLFALGVIFPQPACIVHHAVLAHHGKLAVTGGGAVAYVDGCRTDERGGGEQGKAQYTLCCDDASGGVVDDLIVYLRGDDDLLLVPNAANCADVERRLLGAAPAGVAVRDLHERLGVLAVQGPLSDEVLSDLGLPTGHDYMSFVDTVWGGGAVTVCRTGYTGERGYELLPTAESAPALWGALLDAVTARGGLACGLGARDTLRTEMGYPLHGHELSLDITPVQARLGWAVGWSKPAFWGRDVLLAEKERGAARTARGLLALDRGIPRADMDVVDGAGTVVGRTTSGTFSPTLRQGIALALLDRGVRDGAEVAVDVRGRRIACRVVKPPFVEVATRES